MVTRRSLYLRKRLTIFFMVSILAIGAVVSATALAAFYGIFKQSLHANLTQQLANKQLAVDNYLRRLADLLIQFGTRSEIRLQLQRYLAGSTNLEDLRHYSTARLADALAPLDEARGLLRLTRDGKEVARVGIVLGPAHWPIDPAHRTPPSDFGPYGVLFSEPLNIDGRHFLVAVSAVRQNEEVLGYDLLFFAPDKLRDLLQRQESPDSGRVFLFRKQADTPLLLSTPQLQDDPVTRDLYQNVLLALPQLQEDQGIQAFPAFKSAPASTLAYSRLPGGNWHIAVLLDNAELHRKLLRRLLPVALVILGLSVLGGVLFYVLLRPLTRQVLIHASDLEQINSQLQQEVRERRQVEAELLTSEQEWASTFESIDDAISLLDPQGQIRKQNRAARRLRNSYGAVQKHRPERRNLLPVSGHPSPLLQQVLDHHEGAEEVYHDEVTDSFFRVNITPIIHDDKLIGAVQLVQNITEERQLEKMKSEMISAVSHEIRTPLTAILGFVEFMLENETSPEQQHNYLQIIQKEMNRLNELMNDFLDLQRLQSSLQAYHFAPTDVLELLRETVALFSMVSDRHRIVTALPQQLPTLVADGKRLQQVFKNILSNAVKYSPAGGTITVSARGSDQSLFVWVQDEGIGIPAQDQQKIFNRFYRVNDGDRRIPGGLGLGLALVDEIVKAHRGRIWVESTLEKGSTFFVELPLRPAAPGSEPASA